MYTRRVVPQNHRRLEERVCLLGMTAFLRLSWESLRACCHDSGTVFGRRCLELASLRRLGSRSVPGEISVTMIGKSEYRKHESGGMQTYLIKSQHRNSHFRSLFPAIIQPLQVVIQKALEFIIRFLLVQIMPFLRWVNSKPAVEVSISTKDRTQNPDYHFLSCIISSNPRKDPTVCRALE